MAFAPLAVLFVLNALGITLLILFGRIVSTLAVFASQRHQCSHGTSSAMFISYHAASTDAKAHMADLHRNTLISPKAHCAGQPSKDRPTQTKTVLLNDLGYTS